MRDEKPVQLRAVGPDTPVRENSSGGAQSDIPYRLDLVPARALLKVAECLKEGVEKYGEWNWLKVSVPEHLNHGIMHGYAHLGGDRSEGSVGHLVRQSCRALFALEVALREEEESEG